MLRLADMRELAPLGGDEARYAEVLYPRTQEIGDAAHFLGFDGLVAPNARWNCLNAVLFTDRLGADAMAVLGVSDVDWNEWRRTSTSRRRSRS